VLPSWVETIPPQGFVLVNLFSVPPLAHLPFYDLIFQDPNILASRFDLGFFLLLLPALSQLSMMPTFVVGMGKQESHRISHREKTMKRGSSDARYGQVSSPMPVSDHQIQQAMKIIITLSDCMAVTRIVARSVLLAMALAAFPFFYAATTHSSTCEWPNNPADCGDSMNVPHGSGIANDMLFDVKPNDDFDLQEQWAAYRVKHLSTIFQDVIAEGLLKTGDKALCIGISKEERGIPGISDAVGFGVDMIFKQDFNKNGHGFPDNSFDFEFSVLFDTHSFPAAEIERTLKIGGVALVHLQLQKQNPQPSNTIAQLLPNFKIVYLRRFDSDAHGLGLGLDTVIAFRKVHQAASRLKKVIPRKTNKCLISDEKRAAMNKLEHILLEQPRVSWIESKENLNNIQYLPNILGYPNKPINYVYVDVGANTYKSSIGAWFQLHYPKQSHKFNIFAIEADGLFGADYLHHPEVKFLPYAAWIRNESLTLSLSSVDGGQIQPKTGSSLSLPKLSRVRGLDFADWLMKTVTEEDYVVVKMDVGGAEFQLLPKMLNTGAICLVDELFLECHYESPHKKYSEKRRAYWECLSLYGMLREEGVAAHQWWG